MRVTKLEKLGKCKSAKIGDRYRFYQGMPPLPPGPSPSPNQPAVPEILPPSNLGAHQVWTVEGDDLPANEAAVFWMLETDGGASSPMCWLVQSGVTLQGTEAIKRVFGDNYVVADKIAMIDSAMDSLRNALARVSEIDPDVRYLLAADTGHGWHVEASNDPQVMDDFRKIV